MARVDAEVIELISDEESEDEKKNEKKTKTCNINCINFQCSSGLNMKRAPTFACTFYGVNTAKKKKRLICEKCLNDSIDHQQILVNTFLDRKPLLNCDFPDHTMEVEISDSDESDNESKTGDNEEDYLPEEFLLDIEQKFDTVLDSITAKYDVKFQVDEAKKSLSNQWDNIQKENDKQDEEIKNLMGKLDKLRNSLYDEFKPSIKMLEELTICDGVPDNNQFPLVATKKVTQVRNTSSISTQDNQPIILEEIERDTVKAAADLPPLGPLVKPVPEVDTSVLIMKHALIPWLKAKVITVINKNPSQYKVKLNAKKHNQAMKIVSGKQVAIAQPCPVIIPVSTRVVALFQDVSTNNFYSGVIAEPPKSTNKYRYLVFFDDGYAQYVIHKNIFLVSESSAQVWEDVPSPSRDFVKKYMESYPERPMVKLQTGQVVKTEWNGKWWIARVVQVDASLVQMHFDADNRTEWIYRGSARLGPLYVELLKANARQQGSHAAANSSSRHRLPPSSNKPNMPYVEYTSSTDQDDFLNRKQVPDLKQMGQIISNNIIRPNDKVVQDTPFSPPQQSRAVAKKSTAKKPVIPEPIYNATSETKPSHSIVYYQTQNRRSPKSYAPHRCNPKCLVGCSFTPEDLKGYSPLSIPLLCGWNRQLSRFSKGKKVTVYLAPCGKRLRNMEELHLYLRVTKSPMSVDLFEFDHWVHCLAEFVLDKCFVNIKDLSYGAENVPIPCVNEIDHALPDTIRYSTQREPTEDVHLNLDSDFLCSCDCTDDCQDKDKCQCWQLTIQGATLGGRVPNTAVGYIYKRLPEPVTTGIYECNSRCKCSIKTCLNRVVQHPLTLKLQVFKTAPRGWGIRCLNDIPQGSFICIYAGRLLTEQGANEGGKNYGDEYLAELDYVEVVEGIKEGYEDDVLDPELELANDVNRKDNLSDDEEVSKPSGYESDEDFDISKYRDDPNLRSRESPEDTSISRRLRKRKKGDKSKGDNANDDKNKQIAKSSKSKPDFDKSESRDSNYDTITLSDEDESKRREPGKLDLTVEAPQIDRPNFKSVRDFFGEDEAVYIMDAKTTGNIGRYLNHSCDPNVFVQNVFVDTHDVRFPWVAFFALHYIRAGQELTWNYSYDVGSIPGKMIICKCGSSNCRGRLL